MQNAILVKNKKLKEKDQWTNLKGILIKKSIRKNHMKIHNLSEPYFSYLKHVILITEIKKNEIILLHFYSIKNLCGVL